MDGRNPFRMENETTFRMYGWDWSPLCPEEVSQEYETVWTVNLEMIYLKKKLKKQEFTETSTLPI